MTLHVSKDSNPIEFNGGSGNSLEDAVVINGAKNESDGIKAEYQYIAQQLGEYGAKWKDIEQTVIEKNGKMFDEIQVDSSGKKIFFYFDISNFFAKSSSRHQKR